MSTFCKISSVVYRVVFTLVIPVSLLGNFLTAAAGHNRGLEWSDYALFIYIIATVTLLTLYSHRKREHKTGRLTLFFVVASLILISIIMELYQLYDIIVVCECFAGEPVSSLFLSGFLLISVMVFYGLVAERSHLVKRD